MTRTIERVAVLGAGRMGHGIALTYALAGREVALFDSDEAVLADSPDRIAAAVETLARNDVVADEDVRAVEDRLTHTGDFGAAVGGADLVTEAVTEDLGVKRKVFGRLADATDDAILATNTSGLPLDDIAAPVPDPGRVLGTHWFNPPYVVPLVEVVKGSETDPARAEAVYALLDAAGKTPVMVEKPIPGFIGNRIQAAMTYEAFSLLAAGVASPADIDRAVKASFGFRLPILGVFEKIDQSGLDIHHEVEKQLMAELDRGTDPNPVIAELLERGHRGVVTGKGVYDWTDVDTEAVYRERDDALLSLRELYRDHERPAAPANYDRTGDR